MSERMRRPVFDAWFDAQYDNRARIPEHPAILRYWAEASASALRRPGWVFDLAYGDHATERLDVLPAATSGAPVFVYIHGGYWRALDKRDHAFIAPPLAEAGAMVVLQISSSRRCRFRACTNSSRFGARDSWPRT